MAVGVSPNYVRQVNLGAWAKRCVNTLALPAYARGAWGAVTLPCGGSNPRSG